MKEEIVKKLEGIEEKEQVKILFAVESGSRAWGFESQDSDWDVRFVYQHYPEWYLSIYPGRDVIDINDGYPLDENLIDVSGWDIKKALGLFNRSNPPLLEWIESPIIYMDSFFREELIKFKDQFFSPKSCAYHYMHMAEGNFRSYLKSDIVRVKKYFYVLRPVLASFYIKEHNKMPPVVFEELMAAVLPEGDPVRVEVEELIRRKKSGEELDKSPMIPIINDYLEKSIEYLNKKEIGKFLGNPTDKESRIKTLDALCANSIAFF